MDNNQSKKTAGAIALIVIAVIVITVIIIAIVTNRDSNKDPDVTDKIEDNAESDLSDAVTDMIDDASEALDDVKDAVDPDKKDTDKNTENDTADTKNDESGSTDTDNPMTPDVTASLPTEFCLPVTGYISKGYSMDTPVFSLTMNDYRTHSGIDIGAEEGTAVSAFADGTVTDIYTDPFMGVCIEVTHSGGMVSKYMSLNEELGEGIEAGAAVKCGQTIAKVGNTAALEASDESHLHFEVMLNDRTIDPMEYIDTEVMADTGYEN